MIPIYSMSQQSEAIERQLGKVLLSLGVSEGWLDSKFRPILIEGFRYDNAIMKGVQLVADEGGCAWKDTKEHHTTPDPNQATLDLYLHDCPHETEARMVADILGYESVANCAAMWREAIGQGLLTASERGGSGFISVSDYGIEQLEMWEGMGDDTN
ncbi:MAG: hypothetical protein GY820_00160 [Gammaproteobacteria bacterium]|nr:hypothetical protein [Gammaproteobacteria bacterium]